jgi:hypothetical protein
MSNVSIAYPNRLLELKTIHRCDWVDNPISSLTNIQTPILSETGRTLDFNGGTSVTDKHCSFGLSLSNLPYRTFGAVALINHNFSTSARFKFTVFNEPPITYAATTIPISANPTYETLYTFTVPAGTVPIPNGTKVKIYGCDSEPTDNVTHRTDYFYGTVQSTSGVTVEVLSGVTSNTSSYPYKLWYIGYGRNVVGKTESNITNKPKWVNAWNRIYPSTSSWLTWRSKNLWRGCVEEEQRLAFTKIHISFLKDAVSGEQPTGTHLHIDLNDTVETVDVDNFMEIGRVFIGQYSQPTINPEYGSIEHSFIDNSEITSSNSGTEYAYEKAKARTVSVQWNHLTEDEAFGGIYEASRSQGITREVLYAYDVDDTGSYQYARSFVGRFTQLNAITQPNYGLYGASINLKEIL